MGSDTGAEVAFVRAHWRAPSRRERASPAVASTGCADHARLATRHNDLTGTHRRLARFIVHNPNHVLPVESRLARRSLYL